MEIFTLLTYITTSVLTLSPTISWYFDFIVLNIYSVTFCLLSVHYIPHTVFENVNKDCKIVLYAILIAVLCLL